MLPDMDGLDVCRQLRSRADTPILMLTARGDAMDRVIGLEMGADDYLPKPFEPRELLARLKTILRRSKSDAKAEVQSRLKETITDGLLSGLTAEDIRKVVDNELGQINNGNARKGDL